MSYTILVADSDVYIANQRKIKCIAHKSNRTTRFDATFSAVYSINRLLSDDLFQTKCNEATSLPEKYLK
jgi:hypothetical protein